MLIEAGQIYLAKNVSLGKAHYPRPCLVLRVSPGAAHVAFFSTKIELARPIDLIVHDSDSGFKGSGLKETSCLLADRDVTVDRSYVDQAKLLGRLAREVKLKVENWWGDAIG
jgi:hypothetical protein